MKIIYVLSSRFNYANIIAPDTGPDFAADYGWETIGTNDLPDATYNVAIVDPRVTEAERASIETEITRKRGLVVLRLVDPYAAYESHWWYQFVAGQIDKSNVHVMLSYHPAEITAGLFARAERTRFIFAPNVYDREKEKPIDHDMRTEILLLSGSIDAATYPVRTKLANSVRRGPLSLISKKLQHPGYPDTGVVPAHTTYGEEYLTELSKFRYAVVCSSRLRLEFLKYREFAYAGVVPVGDLPATLLDCPQTAWVPWRRNTVALAWQLVSDDGSGLRARQYRAFMSKMRDRGEQRRRVQSMLSKLG